MMRKFVQLIPILAFLLAGAHLKAQPSKTYPSEPAEFIEKFVAGIEKMGSKETQQYIKLFQEKWTMGFLTQSEQERFISQVNIMLLKNYNPGTELLPYAQAIDALKAEESFGKVNLEEFFTAADSCILLLKRPKTLKFYRFIETFCTSGAAFKTSNASWSFTQANPKLSFTTVNDPESGRTVSFPYFTFDQTRLIYRNKKDSTIIRDTKGQLNLMNKVWDGEGGILDWAKMNLDPSDVYAELQDYGLNLNYSFVKIDTVIFHYNSLIGKPLKGKYEDMNRGYGDINKANYPSFRSYEGGVVIENFIPNVRYEGGFSLRGIRKIGSAHYEWVEVERPEIPEEEPEEEIEEDEEPSVEDEWAEAYDYDDSAFYFEEDDEIIEDDWDETDSEEYTDEEVEDEYDEEEMEDEYPEELEFLDREYTLVKAKLDVFHNDEKKMTLRALEFVLDLEKLVSRRTEVALHISEEDSITHPSVDVVYEVDSATVTLMKDVKDKKAHQAFLSPYHGYYLYFDAIVWDQKTDQINFTSLIDKENQNSAIESYDFFNLQRMRQNKGILSFNPVGAIWRYMNLHPGETITAEDLVTEYKKEHELPALLLQLVEVEGSGYIEYDKNTHEITPLDKLELWARAARGKKDYDAISILSRVQAGNNGELNLNDNKIDMFGVKYFSLSDSQFVRTIPNQMHVKVMSNRDLNYDGRMAAGKLNFYGRVSPDTAQIDTSMGKFTFQYDNFKILCDSLDSLKFDFERDKRLGSRDGGMTKLQKALQNTTIEGVTGAIYINKPDNKNGLEPHPEYPVFDSYTKSYVYWYNPNVRDGVYSKDKFYFAIDPFVLDSLESFDEASLSFEGEFESSGIMPRIRQKLTVMEDYTLGLVETTPADTGYATYDGKGRFKGDVQLDGSGLSSDGVMEFMNTTAESDSFQMFFDSVKAVTNEFTLPKGTRENGAVFPQIDAKTVGYKWLTQKDQIELETTADGEPIVLFEGEGTFEGKLIVTELGLKGNGTLTMGNVSVQSEEIDFNEMDFKAKGGTFTVFDKTNPGKQLYVAENTDIEYNVNTHHSEFKAKEVGVANSSFPEQQFKTSLGKGAYDKEKNELVLNSLSPKKGNNFFYSSDPKQDSLAFLAENAIYNFDEKEIKIDGVPYIYVADAKITPDNGLVNVKPDGYLQKLENSVIEANLETKYHRMYESDVDILSSKYYEGSGKYEYVNIGGKDQYINMTEIKVRADTLTIAKGTISEDQEFYLTDRILFKGSTELEANRKFMQFRGQVKIENEAIGKNWINFDTIVNPDSVFIPIGPEVLGKLVVGLHYIERNRVFYSTFLQTKKENRDLDLALAAGGLTFDRNTNEFRIGPAKKLTEVEYRGTTSSFDDVNNVVTTVGKLDFPFKFNKNTITGEVSGKWRDDLGNREITSDLMLKFGFSCIPKEAWEKLGDKFALVTGANDDVNFTDPLFLQSLSEFLDPNYKQPEKNTAEFVKKVAEAEVPSIDVKVYKDLGGDVFLSGVRFKFSEDYKSLYYAGNIDLIGIGGKSVNKVLGANSRIEFNKGKYTAAGVPLSDTLRVYLESDEFNSVYFEFHGNVLYTYSTDTDGYMAELTAAIEKRKKNDGYRFELVSDYEVQEFQERFVKRYVWTD